MKTRNICAVWAIFIQVTQAAPAASNDLSAALQKGLFEEEANHNFAAAISAYQSVVAQFDAERKLAGTAVFRLGEIYRKQGKTNEAYAQYERVLREFSDQLQLVTLSQSYLATRAPAEIQTGTTNRQSDTQLWEPEEVKRIQAMIRDSPDLINATDPSGNTPLHTAAGQGQLVVAQFLLANGAEVDAMNPRAAPPGRTPLHYAAMAGHKALVELLLSKNARVQATDADGYSPLHVAAENGFRSIVEVLLAHGGDPNARTKSNATPLHLAIANGFKSVAELLLAKGTDVNAVASSFRAGRAGFGGNFEGTALHIAVQRSDQTMIQLLLTNKADVNIPTMFGDTALHFADHGGLVELLLDRGASIDAQNKAGRTPLFTAVANEKAEVVKALLEHKANPDIGGMDNRRFEPEQTTTYRFPVHAAIQRGNDQILKLLLEHGANPNIESSDPAKSVNPPLWLAVSKKQRAAVDLLLNAKADPNIKVFGRPLLSLAVETGDEGIVASLLAHNVRVDEPYRQGETPLYEAVGRQMLKIVELLLAAGANPNAKIVEDRTPLFRAVGGDKAIVELLLVKGADPNLTDKQGNSALAYVGNRNSPAGQELVALLREHGAVEDVPRLDRIEVRRPSANYKSVVFIRGTNDYNRYTVFELLAAHYGFVSANPIPDTSQKSFSGASYTLVGSLGFPDLEHVRLRRSSGSIKRSADNINLTAKLTEFNCSGDEQLQWGDVVEIPEADHPINANWQGLPDKALSTLKDCVTRQIQLTVKGQTTNIALIPEVERGELSTLKMNRSVPQFCLLPVLVESGLLRASSDLTRVKVNRRDSATGQQYELILDCSKPQSPPDFWLRNGDVIEVPEKPGQ